MPRSQLLSMILLPLSKLYGAGVWVRNKMFDWNILKSHKFDIPVIAVGNIAVGGTGKTPHTEYIVNVLRNTYHVGVLSRGYKRETKGFVMATPHSAPRDIGDESYQIYHKFKGKVAVAVCEDRVKGISRMLEIDPAINIIVLDDALQHRYVRPQVTIVLTEYNRPGFSDSLLPYGRLRESKAALRRADMVIVTKCPDDIKPIDFRIVTKHLDLRPYQRLYFTHFCYGNMRAFNDPQEEKPLATLSTDTHILLITGIASATPLVNKLREHTEHITHLEYGDHHSFAHAELRLMADTFARLGAEDKLIVTTEKDAARLSSFALDEDFKESLYVLPIQVEFLQDQQQSFDNYITDYVSKNSRNRIVHQRANAHKP